MYNKTKNKRQIEINKKAIKNKLRNIKTNSKKQILIKAKDNQKASSNKHKQTNTKTQTQ